MVGMIPLSLPGMSVPVRLGIAGGPIVVGILVGSPRSARAFHILYHAFCIAHAPQVGVSHLSGMSRSESAGGKFFETVMRPEGILWVGLGFLLTVVPVLIVGLIALRTKQFDFGSICGILCGSMANPDGTHLCQRYHQGARPGYQLCHGLSFRCSCAWSLRKWW